MSSCYVYYVTILENQWKLTQCITIHIDDTIRISWALTINTIEISPYRYTSINQTSWLLQMMIMNIWWQWTLCIPNDKAFFSSRYIIYRNCLEKNPMETMKSGQIKEWLWIQHLTNVNLICFLHCDMNPWNQSSLTPTNFHKIEILQLLDVILLWLQWNFYYIINMIFSDLS